MSAILAILIWPIAAALTIVLISVTADYIESFMISSWVLKTGTDVSSTH